MPAPSAPARERKNVNLPGVVVDLPTLTDKDIDDLKVTSRTPAVQRPTTLMLPWPPCCLLLLLPPAAPLPCPLLPDAVWGRPVRMLILAPCYRPLLLDALPAAVATSLLAASDRKSVV